MKYMRSKVEVLSESEIVLIHKHSLRLLEKTGMRVPNREVCQLAKALGAVVDETSFTVYLPTQMMEELLTQVRLSPGNAAHRGDRVEPLTGNVSTQVFLVDELRGMRRYGTLADVRDGIALIEGLPHIPRANAVVVPGDVPSAVSDVICYQNIYKYAKKPGGTYILTPGSARYIIEMSRVMGREVSYLFDTISPLSFAENSLEIALLFREHELELTMTPMVMAGSTGPVTLSGLLTLQNAEVLGSLFFIYAITGKIPAYIASGHTSDVRHNMFCSFGSPNQALIGAGVAQMAAYYGLECGSNAGLSDALRPDFQCGFEKGLSAVISTLAGGRAIGGQGICGADQGFSFAQLVLDNEWLSAFAYTARGIEVSEETIGMETIEDVGIGGNFLSELHTVEYMREYSWESTLFARDTWDVQQEDGQSLLQKADARARELVSAGRADEPVVSPAIAQELDRLAQEAIHQLA